MNVQTIYRDAMCVRVRVMVGLRVRVMVGVRVKEKR